MLGKETVFSPRPIDCIRFANEVLTYETRRFEAERTKFLHPPAAASTGKSFLVAIEGPNGAGKTRLCSLLGQAIGAATLRGVPAAWEDSSLKLHMIRDVDWLASAMYFLSGVIESSRQAGLCEAKLQVMDRSLWSTLAVHYAHDPARMETLLPLFELAADRLAIPDLTIVLEADAATCRQRIARSRAPSRSWTRPVRPMKPFAFASGSSIIGWPAKELNVVFLDANVGTPEDVCQRAAQLIRGSVPCCC